MQFTVAIIASALAGLAAASPVSSPANTNVRRYVPGQCGIHVTQWQKNENGVGGDYQYDIQIFDAIGEGIGGASRLAIPDYHSGDLYSQLPYTLVVTSGGVDNDPVGFAYAGYVFTSYSGCRAGPYDSGNRDMDCGFPC
ncbi:hypothetical protein F4803DRAFT_572005 [Xylaria telfairii]|nr:hypothetical protein F4803DRAFT_572005 [Xylaria telfairii]